MKAKLALTFGLTLGLAAFGHAVGCGGEGGSLVADAGPEAAASPPRRDASPTREAPEPDSALPEIDGKWQLYPDFLPSCALYLPKTSADMPAPLRWEPCPDNPSTPGRVCRKVVTDWEGGIRDTMSGFRRTNGAVVLMSTRVIDGDLVHLISEPDGPVELAVRVHSNACGVMEAEGDGEHFVYFAGGSYNNDGYEAALAGKLGERPHIVSKHILRGLTSPRTIRRERWESSPMPRSQARSFFVGMTQHRFRFPSPTTPPISKTCSTASAVRPCSGRRAPATRSTAPSITPLRPARVFC